MDSTRFSLIIGGPFHGLLRRVGLLDAQGLPRPAAALVLVALAWGVPASLVGLESLMNPAFDGSEFWRDPRAYTRWGLALAVMALYERMADGMFQGLARNFRDAGIVTGAAAPGFAAALARADRRMSSALAEAGILAVAVLGSLETVKLRWALPGSHWAGVVTNGDVVLTWSGYAVTFLSDPLFAFMFLRWLWRFAVLNVMLFEISRLPLRLNPTHPDGHAGLGFLASYPLAFLGLVFALSRVLAAGADRAIAAGNIPLPTVIAATAVWVAFILLATLSPLAVFAPTLNGAKAEARRKYCRLADRHNAQFQQRWLSGHDAPESSPMGAPEISSLADMNTIAEKVLAIRIVPLDQRTVVAVGVAAGLPMALVMPTQVPLLDLLPEVLGLLF